MTNADDIRRPPFFSVIITTYNRAEFLIRAVKSLIRQTESDWEAIIVDDGSTDNTAQALQPFLDANPALRYVFQKNLGCVGAKNTGIKLAKGRYLTFLDSDDEYAPIHLETRKAILTENPEIDFLRGGIEVIGNPYVPDRFDHTKMMLIADCAIGGTFFIERTLMEKLDGFRDIPYGHDSEMHDRAIALNAGIMRTNTKTYIYHRDTESSMTNDLARESGNDF